MGSVAVLFVGGLRGFDVARAKAFDGHVLRPLAEQTDRSVDLFACNEDAESVSPELQRILEGSGAAVTLVKTSIAPYEDAKDVAFAKPWRWALRVRQCYEATRPNASRYDFYVRVRPDLIWDGPLPPVSTWSNKSVMMRMRDYVGPQRFTAANQVQGYGAPCGKIEPSWPCAAKGAECMIADDQLFIVPAVQACVTMNYASGAAKAYDDKDWCAIAPIHRFGSRNGAGCTNTAAEMHFTYYLARNGVPMSLLAARATLLEQQPPSRAVAWDQQLDCRPDRMMDFGGHGVEYQERDSKTLFWLHIPKCGTSFERAVEGYKEDLARQHACCNIHKLLPIHASDDLLQGVVTMFREPKQRLAAAYSYIAKVRVGSDWGWSLETSRAMHENSSRGVAFNDSEMGSFVGCQTSMVLGYGCMARHDYGGSEGRSKAVEQAIERVSKFRFFGLQS